METIFELYENHGKGKGEEVISKLMKRISKYVEQYEVDDDYWKLYKDLYSTMCGGHFNKCFAEWQIKQLYYVDNSGLRHYGPYWREEDMEIVWDRVKGKIKGNYNYFDFIVTLNMIRSDNFMMLKTWFPEEGEEEYTSKLVDMTVNWLNDEDAPHKDTKIWSYFND